MEELAVVSNVYDGFGVTFIQSTQRGYYYSKLLNQPNLKLPYWNTYMYVEHTSFKAMCERFESIIGKPMITQIMGVPRDTLTKGQKVRRTLQNFSFAPPTELMESAVSVSTRYLLLDIDKDVDLTFYPQKVVNHVKPQIQAFKSAYESYELTPSDIISQARLLASLAFKTRYSGEIFVRLSASFGKSEHPYFRGHVYIPLSETIPIDDVAAALYTIPFVDHTPYFNPTQPVFTAAPIIYSPGSNQEVRDIDSSSVTVSESAYKTPLTSFTHLRRTSYDAGNGTPLSISHVHALHIDQITKRPHTSQQPISNLIPATELSGKRGAFNRIAQNQNRFSVHKWLTDKGYSPEFNNDWRTEPYPHRYVSPTSESRSPGCVAYSDGYLIDFHDHSPIKELAAKYLDKKAFSAYDLWYLHACHEGNLNKFRRQVDNAVNLDPAYQKVWSDNINRATSFITESLRPSEIDEIIYGILEDLFIMGIKQDKRMHIYEVIVSRVRELKIKDYRKSVTKLEKLFREIAREYATELNTIHPSNSDIQNAKAFLDVTQMFVLDDSYVAENLKGDKLDLVKTEHSLEQRVHLLLPMKSNAPTDWSTSKLNSASKQTVIEVRRRYEAGLQSPLNLNEALFLFRNDDSRRAIDVTNGQVHSVLLNQFVLHELPFSEATYIQQRDRDPSGSSWLKFLNTTFEGSEDNIEHIRDYFTYLFSPNRSGQIILGLIGVTRSGKSTIKNTMVSLISSAYAVEAMMPDLQDQFALANITSLTRLFVVNEFNLYRKRAQNINKIINLIKAASGDDQITIRRMHQDPINVKCIALPVIISNEVPTVTDAAFKARLRVVRFNHCFAHEIHRTGEFQNEIKNELPFIFHWAITNPRFKNGVLRFHRSKLQEHDTEYMEARIDVHGAFFKKYLKPGNPSDVVFKKELKTLFSFFFEKTKGYTPEEWDLSNQKFGLDRIQPIIPTAQSARVRVSADMLDQSYTPDVMSEREWVYKGVKWADEIKELLPFGDLE